jgi:hypothetical protein
MVVKSNPVFAVFNALSYLLLVFVTCHQVYAVLLADALRFG